MNSSELLVLIVFAGIVATYGAASPWRDAAFYWRRGYKLHLKGQFEKAIRAYDKAILKDKHNVCLYVNRGASWRCCNNLDKAVEDFNRAIRIDPENGLAYSNRAGAFLKQNAFDNAIADYAKAIQLDAADLLVYLNYGLICLERGDADVAFELLSKAVSLDPDCGHAFAGRGFALSSKGEFRSAIGDYEEAIRLAPNDPIASNNLAWLLATCPDESLRDGSRAEALATKACEICDWKDCKCVGTLAAAYAASGAFDKAVQTQQRAIALASNVEIGDFHSRLELYANGQSYVDEMNC